MGLEEKPKYSPEENAWKEMVNNGLLKTYLDMDGKKVVEVMKGERELPDTEGPIQDYLMHFGELIRKTEGID